MGIYASTSTVMRLTGVILTIAPIACFAKESLLIGENTAKSVLGSRKPKYNWFTSDVTITPGFVTEATTVANKYVPQLRKDATTTLSPKKIIFDNNLDTPKKWEAYKDRLEDIRDIPEEEVDELERCVFSCRW